MKYPNLKSFQKHLQTAGENLSEVYLLCVPSDFERIKVFDLISSYYPAFTQRFSGEETPLIECLDAMQNMSLFGNSLVMIDRVDKFSKKEQQTLLDQLSYAAGKVVLATPSKLSAVASFVEEKGVVLDLLGEKPWEKEKRVLDDLMHKAEKAGKKLFADAASLLLEKQGVDPCLLQNELDKLICFTGDRKQITREDVAEISLTSRSASLWQTAEKMIWEGEGFYLVDANDFHPFLAALRSQIHLGLTLSSLIERKSPSEDWNQFLPKIFPKTLEKRSSQAARFGRSYFERGLETLLEVELLSRSGSSQYGPLLDLFRAKMHG